MSNWIWIALSVAAAASGYFWRREAIKKLEAEPLKKSLKWEKWASTVLTIAGAYFFVARVIEMLFGPEHTDGLHLPLWPERTRLFGYDISITVINTWIVMAFLIGFAIVIRLTILRHLSDPPRGAQNVMEVAIEQIMKYVHSRAHGLGEIMGSYIFTIVVFLVACALMELFGLRTPTADITLTFALALMTFFLINWYGFKKKGVIGRLKAMAQPTTAVFFIRVITDVAIPVSMASRLFGNMLGGMIVMDLVYKSLGSHAVGFPSLLGVYFNVFHPLIQTFIFVTLTLTFINEAIE
jgi:F-type H+-transporting ATPase subunit a